MTLEEHIVTSGTFGTLLRGIDATLNFDDADVTTLFEAAQDLPTEMDPIKLIGTLCGENELERRQLRDSLLLSAAWVDCGAPIVSCTDSYAAALVVSEPSKVAPSETPWNVFLLRPPSFVPLFAKERFLVSYYPNSGEVVWSALSSSFELFDNVFKFTWPEFLHTCTAEEISEHRVVTGVTAPDIHDVALATSINMIFRLIANLICAGAAEPEAIRALGKRRDEGCSVPRQCLRDNGKANVSNYLIGRPVSCDFLPYVREWVRSGAAPSKRPGVKFVVRGHWRNQAYGTKHACHRLQWIEPHMKGSDDAPLVINPKNLRG